MHMRDDCSEIVEVTDHFFAWLTNEALPLWSTEGVDWTQGGFVEQLTPDGAAIADVRRARLVARQIFAFKSAGDLGWSGPVDRLVQHGLEALRLRHVTASGEVVPRYLPGEDRGEGAFDLYDQAFVLFGLAHGYAHTQAPALLELALTILSRMRGGWALSGGGFAEHKPAQAPLKANPHMHMLEAALAWIAVSDDPVWTELARELVKLCLSRFIDPNTGGLHEYFNVDWSVADAVGDVIEPGHQVEWAWLLGRWNMMESTSGLEPVAARLIGIAEEHGINRSQQRLVNELHSDLSIRDPRLRLWPQTERIKALVLSYERSPSRDLAETIAKATRALLRYFEHPIAGSWWEHFDESGNPMNEPARASSLYHIMGAANELSRLTGISLR